MLGVCIRSDEGYKRLAMATGGTERRTLCRESMYWYVIYKVAAAGLQCSLSNKEVMTLGHYSETQTALKS